MIRAVLLFPILVLSLYGLGEWLRARLLGPEPLSVGRIGRALGFGLLAHGLLMTLLGFVWLLRPPIAAALTVLPVLIFWKIWWRDLRTLFTRETWNTRSPLNIVEIVFLVLIIALTLLRGFNALAPNISWDATSHHYLVPSVWLEAGRLSDLPSVIYSYYPSLIEMGIAGAMALGTDFLSNLYGWLYGVLPILLLIGICTRHFNGESVELGLMRGKAVSIQTGRFAGIAAAFLFTLFPGVGVQTAGGYVDLPLACWTLLTIDLLLELRRNPTSPVVVAAALFAGATLSSKHLGILLLGGFLVLLLWILFGEWRREARNARLRVRFILLFIAVALVIVLPWYIRSVWLTGNPFYPFGLLGLPTPPHPPFTPASWIRPDYHRSLVGFLTYWLHLAFSPSVGHALGRNYSIAFPILLPLAVLIPRLKPVGRVLAALAVLAVLFIYWLFPIETRYHLPFLAPCALVFGLLIAQWVLSPPERLTGLLLLIGGLIAVYYLSMVRADYRTLALWTIDLTALAAIVLIFARTRESRATIVFLLLLVLGIGSFMIDVQKEDLTELNKRYRVILNTEPEDKYLISMSPRNYGTIHHINTEMDWQGMRILCLEPRLYRLKADWVTWFGLEEPIVPTTPAENVAIWYRGGFTHILLGDDVALKALMYYNIVHKDGWDIESASPEELVEYLNEHPEEDKVYFRQPDLWFNIVGEPMVTPRSAHWRIHWLTREISRERYPEEPVNGVPHYVASRLEILTSPERLAQYSFVRDFREMIDTGGIRPVYDDELTFLFECDYPAYLESHPDVDLETLGLVDGS